MSEPNPAPTRAMWLTIFAIASVMIAAGAGALFHSLGADATDSMTAAGASFVASMMIFNSVWHFFAG